MRSFPRLVLAGAVVLVGCERSNPVQPTLHAKAPSQSQAPAPGKPEIDPTYANGQTVFMIGPHLIPGARESMPQLYAHSEELYLVVYPQQVPPSPGAGPITLPGGYQPQCNPCFHPGLPSVFVYHDHVITGAPGMGVNGTAGEYKAPWKIILLMYDPDYVSRKDFTPITSATALDAAEAAGNVFRRINDAPGGNPYEIETGNVLICPIVSSHA
jgi:hypothetical protein